MSFLGDVGNFELFNLGAMGNQIKDNPARLLYGSADPFSTNVWNKVLGTHDKPLVDQWGGAAPQRYEEAEDAGINTGPGKSMHTAAKVIASLFAGGAAAGAASGAGGAGASSAGSGLLGNGATSTAGASTGTGFGLGQPLVAGETGAASYAGGASPGLLGSIGSNLTQFNQQVSPYLNAASKGQQVYGLLNQSGPQRPQGPQIQASGGGPQTLTQLAQGTPNPLIAQRQQYAAQRRAQRGY